MVKSFISTASKKVTDVRSFLREASSGTTIKYVAEKGAKHWIYIPYVNVKEVEDDGTEVIKKQVVAISGDVHDWTTPDGKYRATICIKDVIRKAEDSDVLINDGSCSFCDRVSDAWDIYRYRMELEEANCKLKGEDRKKHLEKIKSTFADERKAKDARTYMYILVVKFRYDGNEVIEGSDKLPEYDLKIMKLSSSRVEKMQQQIANSGLEMPGSELLIEYPSTDDRRLQVSQSTTAPVFPNNMLTAKYENLLDKITKDVNKFEWEGIEKAFQEWAGMSSAEADKITEDLFEKWDEYKKEVLINPAAKYMEYISDIPTNNPDLGSHGSIIPSNLTTVPTIPNIPDVNQVFGADAESGSTTIKI